MTRIDDVTAPVFSVLVGAMNAYKPKTDDDWMTAAEIRGVFKEFSKQEESGQESIAIEKNQRVSLCLEEAQFRLLDRAFKQAREGEVFFPAAAVHVVAAMKCLKLAKEVPKEESSAVKV